MKKFWLCLFACLFTLSVQASEKDWFFKPYVGADLGNHHQDWETGFGDRHFRSNSPVAHFNVGVNLHQYVGIEAGYQRTFVRDRYSFYRDNGQAILGFVPGFVGLGNRAFVSDAYSKGFTLSLVLKYPVLETTEVFATLGANWARMYYSVEPSSSVLGPLRPHIWKSERHAVGRFGLGINHKIMPNLGGRILYVWENNSDLEARVFPGLDNEPGTVPATPFSSAHFLTAKPKNSHLVLAGLYYQADWV